MALSQSERNLRWRTKYPEKHKASFENWRVENKAKRAAYAREWWKQAKAKDPEKYKRIARNARLKRKYGITLEQYDVLLLAQDGHCALCDSTPEQTKTGVLDVDHCHSTGRIRGLLCNPCNTAIGSLGDTVEGLQRAIAYLHDGGV